MTGAQVQSCARNRLKRLKKNEVSRMTQDPVTGKNLDDRFQFPVVGGPSWERLCDGLKYNRGRDHVEVSFTVLNEEGERTEVAGTVIAIEGQPRSMHNPLVKFIPDYDCSTNPVPLEVSYWPHRRLGHSTDVRLKRLLRA